MFDLGKIKKAKLIYTVISAVSAILMLVFIILTEVFLNGESYVAMFIMLALAMIFCYVAIFTAFSAYDRGVALRLVPVVREIGIDNISEVAWKMSWKPVAAEKFIKKCRKWGYID